MTPTQVGMRCPECSRDRTPVRTMASLHGDPVLTYVLIGINVVLFLGSRGARDAYFDLVLAAGPVADGDLWRPITGAFLHARGTFGFIHIGFNMYLLWILGGLLEPSLGKWRFGGDLLHLDADRRVRRDPAVEPRQLHRRRLGRGVRPHGRGRRVPARPRDRPDAVRPRPDDPHQPAFPFLFPGLNVSIGGHMGGLLGGFLAGWIVTRMSERRSSPLLPVLACAAISAVALAATYFEAREKVGL